MKTISQMLKPRESVFKDTTREDTLNLSDFAEGRIDGNKFFAENFKTQGMRTLFDTAFKRFKGESDTGVIKLTREYISREFFFSVVHADKNKASEAVFIIHCFGGLHLFYSDLLLPLKLNSLKST